MHIVWAMVNIVISNELNKLIGSNEDEDNWQEVFDFNSPEDVLIEVVGPHDDNPDNKDWKNWSIEICTVIRGKEGVIGAASYEQCYSGFLEYAIQDMVDCPGLGWYVVAGVTGVYTKGDGWTTDDDFELYYETFRLAAPDEIALT